eukprot:IDg15218t1
MNSMDDASVLLPKEITLVVEDKVEKDDDVKKDVKELKIHDDVGNDQCVLKEENNMHRIRGHGSAIPRTEAEQEAYQDKMAAARELRQARGSSVSAHSGARPSANSKKDDKFLHIVSPELTDASYAMTKKKSSFTFSLLKRYAKESMLFTGTDNNSWAVHLRKYTELGKSHDVEENAILLSLVQWTLGPGPKMCWERYVASTTANWEGFLRLITNTYSSDVVHARTRSAIMVVSLRSELEGADDGPSATRNYRT